METIINSLGKAPENAGDHKFSDENAIVTESGFEWREHDGIKILVCLSLERHGFVNAFSTRLGGISPFPNGDLNLAGFGEDSDENIMENRRRFLKSFDREYALATVHQVHSDRIKEAFTIGDAARTDQADAIVSDLPGILAAVKTADCVPILIADSAAMTFAAVHAGWRGTTASIAAKTIRKLAEEQNADPGKMVCAIGPAAGGERYEIGRDVMDAFAASFPEGGKYFTPTRAGHALVDLQRANRDQLIASGVPAENIFTAPYCTMTRNDLFFSYRIEKRLYGRVGRLLSVIGLK